MYASEIHMSYCRIMLIHNSTLVKELDVAKTMQGLLSLAKCTLTSRYLNKNSFKFKIKSLCTLYFCFLLCT